MEYIKLFNQHTEYETYINSEDALLPNLSFCGNNGCVHLNKRIDYSTRYFTITSLQDNNVIKFIRGTSTYPRPSEPEESITIYISVDNGNTWEEKAASSQGTILAELNTNEEILIKGYNETYYVSKYNNKFNISGSFNVSGNIMSLIYGDDFKDQITLNGSDNFSRLFENCYYIVSAKNLILPATTLTESCYSCMFFCGMTDERSTFIEPPELPATTLAEGCYFSMFYRTAIRTAPELPATTLANSCYYEMFYGCFNLITAPELPATTLARSCYYGMFNECRSLINAPELPATSFVSYDNYARMFEKCTSLVNAPELPATTLGESCYSQMFKDCTSLINAPVLPALTLSSGCYSQMFNGCSNLTYIKAMFTTTPPSSSETYKWVDGVAASGTFVKNSAATWNVSGVDGIPEGWTVETATE